MWAIITDRDGEVYRRKLAAELLHPRDIAEEYAASIGGEISPETCSHGCACYVPLGCGDITVELRQDPDNEHCLWAAESFFFEREFVSV